MLSIFGWFMLCLLLLIFSFLNSLSFQNFAVDKITDKVSNDLGIQVKIKNFAFRLPNSLVLNGVYIPDQKGDTLFYFDEIKASLLSFHNSKHMVGFSNVAIKNSFINFGTHEGDSVGNYEFFINYLSPPRKDTTKPKVIWTLAFEKAFLHNTTFRYFNGGREAPDFMKFNPNDIRFEKITGNFENLKVIGDSLSFIINDLSTVEHSGFTVEHFEAKTRIHSKGLEFEELKILTPNSSIGNTAYFRYDDWKSMSDFIQNVEIEADLVNSFLSLDDLMPFGDALQPYARNEFSLEGDVSGTIARLKFKNAKIKTLKETLLEGRFDLTGLPDIDNTYLNFDIKNLHTVPSELFWVLDLPLPVEVNRLSVIDYKGRLNGFYNNLVAFGDIETGLGSLKTDINFDFREGLDKALYSGKLKSKGFDLGGAFANNKFGKIELSVELKNGVGMTPEKFAFNIDGTVSKIFFNGYTYKNINLEGKFSEALFYGKANIKDPNLKLDFAGFIDMTKGIEQSDFFANVHSMDLQALGIDTVKSGFTGWVSLKAKGRQIDNMAGSLLTRDIEVFRGAKKLKINTLSVHSDIENKNHTINLFSDFADIRLSGQFSLKNLPAAIQDFTANLLPGLVHKSEKPSTTEQIDFSIQIKDANKLISLFDSSLLLDKGTVNGGFNSQKGSLVIKANLDDFSIAGINFGKFTMSANKSNGSELKIHVNSGLRISGSKFKADSMTLESVVTKNFLTYTIRATDKAEDLDLKGKGNLSFDDFNKIDLFFEDLDLHIKGKDWKLRDTTSVMFGNEFQLRPIELYSEKESIQATYVSNGTNKKVQVNLNDFDVANINGFMSDKLPDFFGLANGNIDLIPTGGKIQFLSKFKIVYFALNNDTVGTISLESKRENEFQNIVDCEIESGIFNGVTIKGLIGNRNKVDALDLLLKMPSSDVSIFGQFLPGISNLSGGIGGEIKIGGDFSKPIFNGEAFCDNVMLEIDYLRVPFNINAKVNITSNTIDVKRGSTVTDDRGKKAEIVGSLNHKDFTDWSYNVKIEKMNNFHVLATSKIDNDLFYGQAFADGNAHFYGTFDKFNMYIKAKTKKGTQIMMPIGDSEISGPASYISFAPKGNDTIDNRQLDVGFLNTLLIDVEVDPETEIQLIFDEQTGDIIKGAGTGRLLMEVSEDGEFTMRGGVVIERGDYQFVAFDGRVNKKFFIERGGTIMWDGDPMQARIDLVTYNIQSASPNPLLGINSNDPGAQTSFTSVKARSEIKIKGNLFSPEISFGFNILDMMEVGISELSSIVQRIQSDYDEVSRQVFSLLVFGSFMTPTFVTSQSGGIDLNAGTAFTNSIADLISSQVDAWLSQIDDKWLIDFTLTNVTPDQRADMIFKLGRKFVNNRLVFDVTWGTNQAGQANNSFNLEYLASKDGRFRLKAFSRNQAIYNNASVAPVNTIGLGVFYRREFNGWREWEKYDTSTTQKQPIDSLKNDSIRKSNVDSVGLSFTKQRNLHPIKKIYRTALFPSSTKTLFREEEIA